MSESIPYAFISYSHVDSAKVLRLLHILDAHGRKYWFDDGIKYSDDWQKSIDYYFEHSSKFILFLSNGIEQRSEVIREIKMAIDRYKRTNGAYKVFIVLIERVPISYIFRKEKEIQEFMKTVQYISLEKYGGITINFIKDFTGGEFWPEYSDTETINGIGLDTYKGIVSESKYVYPRANPDLQTRDGVSFYTVRVGETDPNTGYPLCVDNQWCPSDYFDDQVFRKRGFLDQNLKRRRTLYQQQEIYRALLHNWQVLINRASIFNTDAIAEWYTGEEFYTSFCELLGNGSFVVYLMSEKSPVDRPRFYVSKENMSKWIELCKKHHIFCIRFDWEDENANSYDIEKRLYTPFREMMLTTADDQNRLTVLYRAMGITDEEQKKQFRNKWKKIRRRVVQVNDEKIKGYSRQMFYDDFLVKPSKSKERGNNENTTNCLLDYRKSFVCELKQIIDFSYMINLPNALHIQPIINNDNTLQDYILFEKKAYEHYRLISADEIYCSVLTFEPAFLQKSVPIAKETYMDLNIVNKIREFIEWREYLETVDAGRKRASLAEIDFLDIEAVWRRYHGLMEKCKDSLKMLNWENETGALTVIYRIDGCKVISIYNGNTDEILLYTDPSESFSNNAREILTIDFICGDISKVKIRDNCFLTTLRLFEGILRDTGKMAQRKIYSALTTKRYKILDDEDNFYGF